jgi:hypothetical protein
MEVRRQTAEAIGSNWHFASWNGWREEENSPFSNAARENMLGTDLLGATTLATPSLGLFQ